jgi:hypothetical protein
MSRKLKFHKTLTRVTGTLHEECYIFLIVSPSVLLRKRDVSEKFCGENQDIFHVQYIFPEKVSFMR